MKTIEVISSQFKKAVYNEETKELYIVFTNDSIYLYKGVPQEVFEGIEKAPSKGSYFISAIKKGHYAYERVDSLPESSEEERATETLNKIVEETGLKEKLKQDVLNSTITGSFE